MSIIMLGEVVESFSSSVMTVEETEVNLIDALLSKSRFIRIMKALITSIGGDSMTRPEKMEVSWADCWGVSVEDNHCC